VTDFGTGDFRFPSFDLRYETDGSRIAPLEYVGHQLYAGKPVVDAAQPAYYVEAAEEATSLVVSVADPLTGLRMDLWYTIFHAYDVLTRRAVVVNSSPGPVQLRSMMAATVDFPTPKYRYTLSHLAGAWARERLLVSDRLRVGTKSVQSRRGASSHQHNPFIIVSDGYVLACQCVWVHRCCVCVLVHAPGVRGVRRP
jgi:alpha-galactosidase